MNSTGLTRRGFVSAAAALPLAWLRVPPSVDGPPFDPWLEVDGDALRRNAYHLAQRAAARPVLAVVKNNAYGLGLEPVAAALDGLEQVAGLAVVKVDEALRLRRAGARKPILFMGRFDQEEGVELAAHEVQLAPFGDDAPELLRRVAQQIGRSLSVHLYIDTGMSRLGVPYHRAVPWMEHVVTVPGVRVEGTFMTFTEDDAFDPEQLNRFAALARAARGRGLPLGRLHAASSHALFLRPDALLDMVRPGLALYGAYPAEVPHSARTGLRCAVALKARVARLEQLREGDSVSYGRNYMAAAPTWVATLPVGHTDGYPRSAVKGCRVQIGDRLFPVIGAVSASHTIVEIGAEPSVRVGDVATLIGPGHPEITPNAVAERAGVSVYDVLMHLNPLLPKTIL